MQQRQLRVKWELRSKNYSARSSQNWRKFSVNEQSDVELEIRSLNLLLFIKGRQKTSFSGHFSAEFLVRRRILKKIIWNSERRFAKKNFYWVNLSINYDTVLQWPCSSIVTGFKFQLENINKTSEYTSKSRFIVLNLKHERNFDLRLKII